MMTDFLEEFEAALAATQSATQGDHSVGGGGGGRGGGGVVGEEMGVYDHMMRPSLGHQMQVELRENIQSYNGNRSSLQEQLSELCFNLHNLYTSPHPPPSPTPSSTSPVRRWQDPNSQFGQAPEKAARRARLAHLRLDDSASGLPEGERTTERKPKVSKDGGDGLDHPGRRNTLLPPINTQDLSSSHSVPDQKPQQEEGEEEEEKDAGGAAAAMPEKAQPQTRTCLKNKDTSEKKALRFGARVELKTPTTTKRGKPSTKGGKSDRKTVRRKSSLKDKPTPFLKLPTVYDVTRRKRFQWDSGKNHVHPKGKSTGLEISQVREDCLTFSHRSVHLPPVQDRKRVEVRYSRPLPRGLTKARLQAASRLQKPLTVLCTESTPVNEGPRSSFGISESFSILPASDLLNELDDATASVLTTSDDVEAERGGERLELAPLPVVRLSESKLSGPGLQATTRHVPRLRLDRGASPGLQSATTGRSGATGLTAATYMSQETLEWKEEYMATGSRSQRDRMLSEIVQIVRQRMRENEEDLKEAGHDPRPSDLQSLEGDEDVRFWDRNVLTPNSGIATGRSTTRRQLQRKLIRRKKQQATTTTAAAAAAGVSPESKGAKLHTYLQKLSQKRKAAKQRPARDRVRFQLTNMTIREITQSSIGYPSSLHTTTHTPLAA